MSSNQVWDISDPTERRAQLDVAMAVGAKETQLDRARRKAHKLMSVLGSVASLLALYDLALLARMGH